ncbi:MAG: hypothetical protein Q4G39_05800 [Brachymonas sp.]|nr:hypothetical protein [Brachymonas sp.]
MKQRKTRLLFLFTLAVFWLSLLLTRTWPEGGRFQTGTLAYRELQGITALQIDADPARIWTNTLHIAFTDQDAITVEVHGQSTPTDAHTLLVREGDRLVLRPSLPDPPAGRNERYASWRIKQLNVPLHLAQLVVRHDGDLLISSAQAMPALTIRTQGHVQVAHAEIGQLHVYSHASMRSPDEARLAELAYAKVDADSRRAEASAHPLEKLASGRVSIASSRIEYLHIENLDGSIGLQNMALLKQIALLATPGTAISLDRLDAMARLQWKPLSEAQAEVLRQPLAPPASATSPAASASSAPSASAQAPAAE